MKNNRLFELDVFRGLAAISVVLFHYTTRFDIIFETDTMSLFEFSYGHYGVQLFFIISGFVIFMSLERSKTIFNFLKRRFLRLYPTFWICMCITFLFTSFAGIDRFERSVSEFAVNFTMIPSLLGFQSIDGVYWSLQVELIFYFIMASLLQAKLINHTLLICFVWLIIGLLVNVFEVPFLNVILLSKYNYLFIAGIVFYKIWKKENNLFMCNIVLFMCLIYGFVNNFEEGVVISLFFVIFYLFSHEKLKFLINYHFVKPFIFLGDISYALYLLHQFIGMTIIYILSSYFDNYFLLIFLPLSIILFLSWIITYFFDKRIQLITRSWLNK